MSQNIFKNPFISSPATLTGASIGNGTLTINRLTHFTVSQNYSAICTAIAPFTVFKVIGSLDSSVGVAVVGTEFSDQDLKLFLTINQGPTLFEIGDTFEFSVDQGTDLNQENLDIYDELPQKNFGNGDVGTNSGDHNLRFTLNSIGASLKVGDLNFVSNSNDAIGNEISIEYIQGSILSSALLTLQDITYTAVNSGVSGNLISIEYINYTPAIQSLKSIQDIDYIANVAGVAGDLINITYTSGGTFASEVVTIVGNDISVQIEDGVSTANSIRLAIVSNLTSNAMVTVIAPGTGSELQTIQAQTFLLGGAEAIAPAGSEIVTVNGNAITVKAENGVSTAQQVHDAILANVSALALITPSISGIASNVQNTISAPSNLIGGADNIGIPNFEIVNVINKSISITFNDGLSSAQQLKTAIEANVSANNLVSLGLAGTGLELQSSLLPKTYLKGGRPSSTYSINTKELTDPNLFYEGNASLLVKDLITQGNVWVGGESLLKGKLTLDDDITSNDSGSPIQNVQKTINKIITNMKISGMIANNKTSLWSNPAGILTLFDDLLIIFEDYNTINTVLSSNGPFTLADGENLYIAIDPLNNVNIIPVISSQIPKTDSAFRVVTRIGTSLIWFDNSLQREGKTIRIGEGFLTPYSEIPTGLIDGINKDFVLTERPIENSLIIFLNGLNESEYIYDSITKTITFNTAPVLGQSIKTHYNIV